MPTRLASCGCGQLTAQVNGEPVRISICHCLACQRRTGSVFGEQARFHFCPRCGSTVYYEPEDLEAFVAIPVGAFADPSFPSPSISVYEERKHQWVVPPPEAEHIP